jgi:hypothetical protein
MIAMYSKILRNIQYVWYPCMIFFFICYIITDIYKCDHLGAMLCSFTHPLTRGAGGGGCLSVILEMRGDNATYKTVTSDMP